MIQYLLAHKSYLGQYIWQIALYEMSNMRWYIEAVYTKYTERYTDLMVYMVMDILDIHFLILVCKYRKLYERECIS